jgi:segregation and condensation protein A
MIAPHRTMEDYRIELDCYAGPLDLLLFLVRRDEIDLHDIPIARLTEQYLEHLKLIQQVDVDLAGEFLVMAATLLEIKSQMLLPPQEQAESATDEQGLNPLDPRYELVQQLLAYKRIKDAAMHLEQRRDEWDQRFARTPPRRAAPQVSDEIGDNEATDAELAEIDLDDVTVLDLCEAFARILETIGQGPARHNVVYDDTPIALHAEDIIDRLTRDGGMTLRQLVEGRKSKGEMVGLFLATLELVRQRKVRVLQDQVESDIRMELVPADQQAGADNQTAPDWRDPQTGEIQYDWPSDEARKRAERRARLRAAAVARRFGKGGDEPADAELEDLDDEADEPAGEVDPDLPPV